MSKRKFNNEAAITAIQNKEHYSIKMVLRELGVSSLSGSNYKLIYRIAKENNLDTSHWLGQAWRTKIECESSVDIQEYLLNKRRINSYHLKNRLIKDNLKEKQCEVCKNSVWNTKLIPLELHHIDGNKYNNSIGNLQILCPNCHAQTDNYCSKNLKTLRGRKRN